MADLLVHARIRTGEEKNGVGSVAPSSVSLRPDCASVKLFYLHINRFKKIKNKMKIYLAKD